MGKYDKQHNLVGEDSTISNVGYYVMCVVYLMCVFGVMGVLFCGFHILGK